MILNGGTALQIKKVAGKKAPERNLQLRKQM